MRMKDIEAGSWVKTKSGVGKVVSTTKFRGMVEVRLVWPLPMGQRIMKPAEVLSVTVPPVEGSQEPPKEWA